jgi:hypothetical protein
MNEISNTSANRGEYILNIEFNDNDEKNDDLSKLLQLFWVRLSFFVIASYGNEERIFPSVRERMKTKFRKKLLYILYIRSCKIV